MRREYYETQKDRKYASLAKARGKKLKIDWNRTEIVRPKFIGTKIFVEYDLEKLVPYFDWDPFF